MANKKVSQLVSKPSVLVTDLFPIADPTTGQLFKTTISDLGTAIGSGVSSVNTLVGAVVLDTDDIQELASPTNRWFTDTRARAALSASSPLAYNSGTGVFSIAQANGSTNGFLSSADWTTFNAKQPALSGTGFVKISGTTISYDNSTYLTTSAAASTYLALAGGTLTGALNGTSATFTGDLTLSSSNPRLYLTDTDNNPDYFISNTDGTFTIYDVTNSTSRFTIGTTGNGTFGGNLTVGQIIRSGGTSAQFLKADGSVDSSTYLTTGTAASTYLPLTGGTLTGNLNGTNITITNSLIAKGGTFNGGASAAGIVTIDGLSSNVLMNRTDTDNGTLISFLTNAVEMWHIGMRSGGTDNFVIYNSNLLANAVSVNISNSAVTLAGALNGTSAIFSSSVRSSGYYLTGMTSGSGALYYSSGSNRVTVANYNASGIVTFEVNGGSTALTLNSNLSATFASGATFSGTGTFSNYISVGGTSGLNSYGTINIPTGEKMILNSYHGLELKTSGGVGSATPISVFNVSSAGAATFSSSVTATSLMVGTTLSNEQVMIGGTGSRGIGISTTTSGDPFLRLYDNTTIKADIWWSRGGSGYMGINSVGGITAINPFGGNVGIGTTSPISLLDVCVLSSGARRLLVNYDDSLITIKGASSGGGGENLRLIGDNIIFNSGSSGSGAERMRITSAGSLLVGLTAVTGNVAGDIWNPGSIYVATASNGSTGQGGVGIFSTNIDIGHANGTASGTAYSRFIYNGGVIGSITQNATSGVLYNITSDYRLKEDLKPINGLEIVNKIKVYDYKWKASDDRMDGVMAHELQEILPYAVTGVKDGDEMQQVDYSKIVPVLIQAIKDQQVQIEQLKNK